jgi:predicted DCC family thiol-disulfide oxidoreductase YuxK
MLSRKAIVFFDGDCALCNRSVQWILRRDRQGVFYFATLHSTTAESLQISQESDSVVLFLDHTVYTQSAAVVRILWLVGGWWRVLAVILFIIPAPLRDGMYRLIARNRYRWFGTQSCIVPSAQERWRFLD